jgi:hypothetical protein
VRGRRDVDFWDRLDTVEEEIARERRHARALVRHVLFFTGPLVALSLVQDLPKEGLVLGIVGAGITVHVVGSFVWLRMLKRRRVALLEAGTPEIPE